MANSELQKKIAGTWFDPTKIDPLDEAVHYYEKSRLKQERLARAGKSDTQDYANALKESSNLIREIVRIAQLPVPKAQSQTTFNTIEQYLEDIKNDSEKVKVAYEPVKPEDYMPLASAEPLKPLENTNETGWRADTAQNNNLALGPTPLEMAIIDDDNENQPVQETNQEKILRLEARIKKLTKTVDTLQARLHPETADSNETKIIEELVMSEEDTQPHDPNIIATINKPEIEIIGNNYFENFSDKQVNGDIDDDIFPDFELKPFANKTIIDKDNINNSTLKSKLWTLAKKYDKKVGKRLYRLTGNNNIVGFVMHKIANIFSTKTK